MTYFEKRMQEALNGQSGRVQKEYSLRIAKEKARRDASKNGFVKECAQQEIDRLEKELARIQAAVGNNYREEYTAEERAGIQLTRLTYSKNAFVQACAAQEISRILVD